MMNTRRKTMAQREPNGRAQRGPQPLGTGEIRRLRDAALSGMRDPLWGTELGRLHLSGKISALQLAAGKRWAEESAAYSMAMLSPPLPRALDFNRSGAAPIDPDSYDGKREARRHKRAVDAFEAVADDLAKVSSKADRAVRSTCEGNELVVGMEELFHLKVGLDTLARFWKLTS